MKEALEQVSLLVERFERNIEAYRSPAYNETQLRREFIDPFFEALDWDVANKAGYAEQKGLAKTKRIGKDWGQPLTMDKAECRKSEKGFYFQRGLSRSNLLPDDEYSPFLCEYNLYTSVYLF